MDKAVLEPRCPTREYVGQFHWSDYVPQQLRQLCDIRCNPPRAHSLAL